MAYCWTTASIEASWFSPVAGLIGDGVSAPLPDRVLESSPAKEHQAEIDKSKDEGKSRQDREGALEESIAGMSAVSRAQRFSLDFVKFATSRVGSL